MRTKKYWQELAERHHDKTVEQSNIIDAKNKAIRFLLAEPDSYRVKIKAAHNYIGQRLDKTILEYVDDTGKFHEVHWDKSYEHLTLLTTSKDGAILSHLEKDHPAEYWLLQKASETLVKLPNEYFCHHTTKICEVEERSQK